MSDKVAERSIDFFIKRTKDSKDVTIAFYGGEPLLNFDLIKHCITYIESKYYGKEIIYSMTTNGTLLNESVIAFLVEKNFRLLISLDGPKEIHDTHRRFARSDEGSHSIIMDNITKIAKLYPDYYQTKVRFNAVLDSEKGFDYISKFISNEKILSESKFNISYVSEDYTEQEMNFSEKCFIEREYEYFKFLLAKLGEITRDKASLLMSRRFFEVYLRCFQGIEIEHERIPSKFHHGGPCIPGVRRLFIDTRGRLFPCERVSELSEVALLGDIETGILLDKVSSAMNLEVVSQSRCKDCWAYRQCLVCIALADDMHSISDAEIAKKCPYIRDSIENSLKDYCVLRELGYMFEEEKIQRYSYV